MFSFASNGFIPATTYYITDYNIESSPLDLQIEEVSYSGRLYIKWEDFLGENGQYELEYTIAGEDNWQTLYSGINLYYYNNTPFETNAYNFRLNCNGFENCPEAGFFTAKSSYLLSALSIKTSGY